MSELLYSVSLYKDFILAKDRDDKDNLQTQYSEYILEKSSEYASLIQIFFTNQLINKKSRIYLESGVVCRFMLIISYYERIITLAPASRIRPFNYNEITDFNANLNGLILSLTGLIDCALYVLIYENCKTEIKIEGDLYKSPQCFEENRNLIKLNDKLFKILKIKELFSEKILVDADWYRKLSNKRNYVAHGVPFKASKPDISSPEDKKLNDEYLEKINHALSIKDFEKLKSLQIESKKIGSFNSSYFGFTGRKEKTYPLYESLPEHVAKTINLATRILNIAMLDNRVIRED